MKKDPTEFRKRFAAWKNGEKPYENGLPTYLDGKEEYKYSWNSDTRSWDRYTSDTMGEVFNDLVVTPSTVRNRFNYEKQPTAQHTPKVETDLQYTKRRTAEELNKRTWRSDVADAISLGIGFTPAGNIELGLNAAAETIRGNYGEAAMLGTGILLPNIIKLPSKYIIKAGLKYAPEFTKNLYDISHLYITPKDNPRLRKYANEVSDLLLSNLMEIRGDKHRYVRLSKNILNTPIYFTHSNKRQFVRPIYNILGKEITSPIPIPYEYLGLYNPNVQSMSIKRGGHTSDEIRQITYHEASHASDLGKGTAGYIGFVPKTNSEYYDMPTEKRARVISILTDAMHNGVDINNFDEMSKFLNIDYKNPNYSSLLNNYNTLSGLSYLKEMMHAE